MAAMLVCARDRVGGLACALQVAAVERGEALAGAREAACSGFGLGQAARIERDVDVTLQAALGIPGGFAMADEADPAGVC
ncbi:hypothetical protein MASR2M50_09550 [Thauera sp.]